MNQDRLYMQLEEEGHIAFSSNYDYERFERSLSDQQKKNIFFDKKQLSVFLIEI